MPSTEQILSHIGRDIPQTNGYSNTDMNLRLRQAASKGDDVEVLRLLQAPTPPDLTRNHAQFGINPETNTPYSGRTALHYAALNNHEKTCIILLTQWLVSNHP